MKNQKKWMTINSSMNYPVPFRFHSIELPHRFELVIFLNMMATSYSIPLITTIIELELFNFIDSIITLTT